MVVISTSLARALASVLRSAQLISEQMGRENTVRYPKRHTRHIIITSFDAEELVEQGQHSRDDAIGENLGTSALWLWFGYEYTLSFFVLSVDVTEKKYARDRNLVRNK